MAFVFHKYLFASSFRSLSGVVNPPALRLIIKRKVEYSVNCRVFQCLNLRWEGYQFPISYKWGFCAHRSILETKKGKFHSGTGLDENEGCIVHRDATPANYLFYRGKTYAIDLELSTEHGNAANDLEIMRTEVFYHFARKSMAYASFP